MDTDGNAIADWWAVMDAALEAQSEADVDALEERMDGWPTIIDVDEYVENEEIRNEFGTRVERIEQHVTKMHEQGNADLATALHGLVSMLTAT